MSSIRKTTLKLPRLRTKDELLKTSPELFGKLLLGGDMGSARSTTLPAATRPGNGGAGAGAGSGGSLPGSLTRAQSAKGAPRGSPSARAGAAGSGAGGAGVRAASAGRRAGTAGVFDTPRGFGEEGVSEEQELAIELDSVKRERERLLEAIAHVKGSAGTAGGEAQQSDIQQLLRELEVKKAKLNELKGEAQRLTNHLQKLRDDNTDAQRLTPGDMLEENAYIQSLTDEAHQVEEDLREAEAKNRLYTLLLERTRREHMAIDQQVRDKQESKRNCREDLHNLGEHFNTTRGAKELAERELAKVRRQVDEARQDWIWKNKERRNEVRELKKRQARDREKEVRKRERRQDKERQEREASAKIRMEQEAYELQVAALAPKIEALEASWNRLRAISGGESPEEVVRYWEGLKSKEQSMMGLVRLAERREASCKQEIAALMARRSEMLETRAAAAAAVEADAAEAAAAAAEATAAEEERAPEKERRGDADEEAGEEEEPPEARITPVERRIAAAESSFLKLRRICIAAEQGLGTLLHKAQIAMGEVPAAAAPPPPEVPATAAPGAAALVTSGSYGLAAGAGFPARTASPGPSGASSARDARALASAGSAGSGSRSGRPGISLLASRSTKRKSLGRVEMAAAAVAVAPTAPPPEPAEAAAHRRSAGGAEDAAFFPGLVGTVAALTERLEKILEEGNEIDVAALRNTMAEAAALAAAVSSLTGSSAAGTVEPTPRAPAAESEPTAAAAEGAAIADGGVAQPRQSDPAAAEGGEDEEQEAEGAEEEGTGEGHAAEEEGGEARRGDAEQGEAEAGQAAADADAVGAEEDAGAEPEAGSGAADGAEQPEAVADAGASDAAADPVPASCVAAVPEAVQAVIAAPGEVRPLPLGQVQEQAEAAAAAGPSAGAAAESSALAAGAGAGAGEREQRAAIMESEKALMKGLERRTWTGAPWLDAVSSNPLDMNLVPSMKRKKGSKKGAGGPDLTRILGYQPPVDADAESDSEPSGDEDEAAPGDGPLDRDWIKMRAAKMLARHQRAAAAAGGAGAGAGMTGRA